MKKEAGKRPDLFQGRKAEQGSEFMIRALYHKVSGFLPGDGPAA